SAAAQMTTQIKGSAKDEQGKPYVGITVIMQSADSGRKYTLKTDKHGDFFSLGIQPGSYNILFQKDGQTFYNWNNYVVKLSGENNIDLDMAKERASQANNMSEEQKKQVEAVNKENLKIKGLNDKLAAARAAEQANNWDQAVQIMQEAVAMDQSKGILYATLGDALTGDKKFPEAVDAYKKAVALEPTRGEYHNNLGQAYLKANQVDDAIGEYTKAAEVDPTNAATYYFNLGAVLTNKNKPDEANAAFDKCIAADPSKADAYYWKGVNLVAKATLDKDGKMTAPEGTSEALNKYLELKPDGPYAQGAKDLLASIGAKVETSFGKGKEKKATKKP
ncbi:MAG: tetratricopeptide repeat protein, partial [Acidobacteriaceae bacterium]